MTAACRRSSVAVDAGNAIEEFGRCTAERAREPRDVHQRDVPLAPLNPADIRPMYAGKFGQPLLRQPELCPNRLHAGTKYAARICHVTNEADDLMTMILQPISSTHAQPPEEITVQ